MYTGLKGAPWGDLPASGIKNTIVGKGKGKVRQGTGKVKVCDIEIYYYR